MMIRGRGDRDASCSSFMDVARWNHRRAVDVPSEDGCTSCFKGVTVWAQAARNGNLSLQRWSSWTLIISNRAACKPWSSHISRSVVTQTPGRPDEERHCRQPKCTVLHAILTGWPLDSSSTPFVPLFSPSWRISVTSCRVLLLE